MDDSGALAVDASRAMQAASATAVADEESSATEVTEVVSTQPPINVNRQNDVAILEVMMALSGDVRQFSFSSS
jgi:hypothetical protein